MAVSRATLPSEFYDRTSEIMLRQPEPAYVYARLAYMASAQAEIIRTGGAVGISPERSIADTGAMVPGFQDMQLLITDNIRAEALLVSSELAPEKVGHTIRFNRPIFSGSGYTVAARRIGQNTSISTTPLDLTAEQVSITINRVGGPYGGTNVQPHAIDRFDAQHSVHALAGVVGLQLQRDRTKYLDSVIGALFDSGANTVYPGDSSFAISTDSSAFTVNGDRPFDAETCFRTEQKLNDLSIPFFANGKYMMVVTPQQARQLKSDPQFQRLAVFDRDRNPLAQSYVGTIGGIEVYQSATNTVDTTTVSGVSINHATAFGPGAVGYVPAGACRVTPSSDDNYGETVKVIWLAYEGQGVLDNRFMVAVHSD